MEIVSNIHLVGGTIANVFLIVDSGGLTLIDTGLPRSEGKILKYLGRIGRTRYDLRRILITHADGDHVGSLEALRTASGARAWASPVEAQAMREGRMSRELKARGLQRLLFRLAAPLFRVGPAVVDDLLAEGQELPVLGGLRVVATPGHTPGHVSFFAPSFGV